MNFRFFKWLAGVLVFGAAVAVFGAAYAQTQAPPAASAEREQARSLAAAGKLDEALAVYDKLTASGSKDVSLYGEAANAAKAARDRRRLAIYSERHMSIDPGNHHVRELIPFYYQTAGDDKNAQRSRDEYVAYWKTSTDPNVLAQPHFMIDIFSAGAWTIFALQCTEIGGDYGIGYMFDIWGPKAPPLPPEELAANHRGRIVLEHNRITHGVMSELKGEAAPLPSLDALYTNLHVTIKWFGSEPSYLTVRGIVEKYVAGNQDLAARPPFRGWGRLTCQRAGAPAPLSNSR